MYNIIKYDIRNINVGDEEETRLTDNIDERLSKYKEKGMSDDDLKIIENLLNTIKNGGLTVIEYQRLWEKVRVILLKYVTLDPELISELKENGFIIPDNVSELISRIFDIFWTVEQLLE